MEVCVNVQQCSCHAAGQVKNQIPCAAKPVLDIVAKYPERPHVADQMQPTAMEKHRTEKRQELLSQSKRLSNVRNRITDRNDCQCHKSPFERARTQLDLPQENQDVDDDNGQ